jgi:hypothetical protein
VKQHFALECFAISDGGLRIAELLKINACFCCFRKVLGSLRPNKDMNSLILGDPFDNDLKKEYRHSSREIYFPLNNWFSII